MGGRLRISAGAVASGCGGGYNAAEKELCKEYVCMENHRKSRVKRNRKSGFRARMQTKKGRQTLSRKRRVGRSTNVSAQM